MANQSPEDIRKAFESSTKEVKKFSGSVKGALKEVNNLVEQIQKLAKNSSESTKGFEDSTKAIAAMAAQSKTVLDLQEGFGNVSSEIVKKAQQRTKYGKIALAYTQKQNIFNRASFSIAGMILAAKQKVGMLNDEELKNAYEAVRLEGKQFSIRTKLSNMLNKGKTALKSQLATWFGIGAILGTIGKMLTSVSGRITEMGSAFGVMGAQTGPFQEALLDSNYAAVSIGKNLSDITSLTDTLASDFGISATEAANLSGQILDSATAMGLSTDEGAKLFGMLVKIGGMTADSAEDFAEQTYQIAKTNDILPHQVMKDIAGFSGAMSTSAGLNFKNLARGAIEARKMGITLSDIVTSTDSLMNIQQSLQTQRTTELITGEKFNLSRLRSLKLADDTAGMAKELQRLLKGSSKFETANYYQRKAYTRLFGMEYDQLVKIRRGQSGMIKEQKTFTDLLGVKTMGAWEAMKGTIATVGITISNELGGPFNEWLTTLNAAVQSGSSMEMINTLAKKIGSKFKEWLGGGYGTELSNMAKNIANMGTHMTTLMGHLNEFSTWIKANKENLKFYSAVSGGALAGGTVAGPWGALTGAAIAAIAVSQDSNTSSAVPGFQQNPNFTPAANSMNTIKPNQMQGTNGTPAGTTIDGNDEKVLKETIKNTEALENLREQFRRYLGPGAPALRVTG